MRDARCVDAGQGHGVVENRRQHGLEVRPEVRPRNELALLARPVEVQNGVAASRGRRATGRVQVRQRPVAAVDENKQRRATV